MEYESFQCQGDISLACQKAVDRTIYGGQWLLCVLNATPVERKPLIKMITTVRNFERNRQILVLSIVEMLFLKFLSVFNFSQFVREIFSACELATFGLQDHKENFAFFCEEFIAKLDIHKQKNQLHLEQPVNSIRSERTVNIKKYSILLRF